MHPLFLHLAAEEHAAQTMYSKEEMKALNKAAKEIYGCRFSDLDFEEQDEIYCYCEETGRF